MNVIVTSLGSISAPFVVQSLLNLGFRAIGVDIYPKSWIGAAKKVDSFFQVPTLDDPKTYETALLKICIENNAHLLLPLTDPEVDVLCERTNIFSANGVKVAIPEANAVNLMRDKHSLYKLFLETSLPVIPTFSRSDYLSRCGIFPCIAKKARGRSSEGQVILSNESDYFCSAPLNDEYIFQPYLQGHVVVADVLRSRASSPIIIGRKELTRTKNGAGIAVEILSREDSVMLNRNIEIFCEYISFEGSINIEFLKTNDDRLFLLDVNPRFSAGVGFSGLAGYDFVRNHLFHHSGNSIEPLMSIKEGAIFTRVYDEVAV